MMCTEKQDDQGECSQGMNIIHHQNIQAFQDQFLLHQQHQNQLMQHQQNLIFPPDPIQTWHQNQIPHSNFNPVNASRFDPNNDPFQTHSSPYPGIFGGRRTGGPFGYDGLVGVGPTHVGSGVPFGLQAELGKMTAQEIMDAKALAASKSHSEAERRRRERINNHLAKLRSLLPSTTKTDKASLLAEVIQHVKELKRQTSLIAETSPVPTESDELTVDNASDEEGRFMIKASLCCEDRSDLIPDLIKTLKTLRLRTLKAEITTLGGRVKNVLFVTGDHDNNSNDDELGRENDEDHFDGHDNDNDNDNNNNYNQPQYCITSIQEALKAVIEKKIGDQDSSGSVKRQRTANNNNINIYP